MLDPLRRLAFAALLLAAGPAMAQTAGNAESGRAVVEPAIDAGKFQVQISGQWRTFQRAGETSYKGDCFMIPGTVHLAEGVDLEVVLTCFAFEWDTNGSESWRGSTLREGYRIVE